MKLLDQVVPPAGGVYNLVIFNVPKNIRRKPFIDFFCL